MSGTRAVVFGAYKSGTTALFTTVRDALGGRPRQLVEPAGYDRRPTDDEHGVVAKVIVGLHEPPSAVDYAPFLEFERRLMLVRDPRDWLVSGTVFAARAHPLLSVDRAALAAFVDRLRAKEADPTAIGLLDLLDDLMAPLGRSRDDTLGWLVRHFDHQIAFEQALDGHLVVHYEPYVAGDVAAIERYLGVPVPPGPAQVDAAYGHVPRTRSAGDWRHWLTAADVAALREPLERYLRYGGYDDGDWDLARDPVIAAEHASAYVERITAG